VAQVVFLTLFLGLVSGRQTVALQVNGDVHAIRLVLDGTDIAKMTAAPWQATIDLGAAPRPRELVAIALDANGEEIARTSQTINLPHPAAEVQIVVHDGRVSLKATHFTYSKVTSSSVKLDDKPLPVDATLTTKLPANLDMKKPHVIAAEVQFADGATARRETVIGGQFGETLPAQMTPVAINGTNADCLGEQRAHVTTIENPDATVILIRDPDPTLLRARILAAYSQSNHLDYRVIGQVGSLGATTRIQPLWPVAQKVGNGGIGPIAVLFPFGAVIEPSKGGVLYLMTQVVPNKGQWNGPRRWADAVAVAGARAMQGGHRRAVILILGDADDASIYDPVAVRGYLAAIGVPLFVWSAAGPRPDVAKSWGDVVDISTPEKLEAAAAAVRSALDAQRIAWLDIDPITALRSVRDACNAAR